MIAFFMAAHKHRIVGFAHVKDQLLARRAFVAPA
jgi:hypothetical protein